MFIDRRTDPVGMKILITDDDTATRKLYREVLELRQFAVEEARTGRECIDLARSNRPSLIVLDLHMPILDGFSAARELRAHSVTRSIPIVAVSGASRDHETEAAIEAGCDVVLNKPISPRDMLQVIDGLLEKARAERLRQFAEMQRQESDELITTMFPDLNALLTPGVVPTDIQIRQLIQGMQVTVCSYCSRVRFPGDWRAISTQALEFFESWTTLSHAVCPDCMAREYPQIRQG